MKVASDSLKLIENVRCVFLVKTQDPLANSPNIDKQLLFPIGGPNCTLSILPGVGRLEGGRKMCY